MPCFSRASTSSVDQVGGSKSALEAIRSSSAAGSSGARVLGEVGIEDLREILRAVFGALEEHRGVGSLSRLVEALELIEQGSELGVGHLASSSTCIRRLRARWTMTSR